MENKNKNYINEGFLNHLPIKLAEIRKDGKVIGKVIYQFDLTYWPFQKLTENNCILINLN